MAPDDADEMCLEKPGRKCRKMLIYVEMDEKNSWVFGERG
jgi:hypothetical protein